MVMRFMGLWGLTGAVALVVSGCAVVGHGDYRGPKHLDAREFSDFDTADLESQDVQTACQSAVSKLLASNLLGRVNRTPSFVVEDQYFENEGEISFDTRSLVDLFRNELVNAGAGRIKVVHSVAEEIPVQADFIVHGRVTDIRNSHEGATEAYTQIAFNVVLVGTGEVVFSDLYSVKKGASVVPGLY